MKKAAIILHKSIFLCMILLVCLPLAASSANGREIYRISLGPNGVQGDHDSTIARISANGAVIAFASRATNFGGGANQTMKVYLYNQTTGAVKPYFPSSSSGDVYPTALSADGRYVVLSALSMYHSFQQDVVIYDQQAKTSVCASVGTDGACTHGGHEGSISGDGRYLVFSSSSPNLVSGDTNICGNLYTSPGTCPDIFLHDRDVSGSGVFDQPGNIRTTRISAANDGSQANNESGNPVISANGRYVVFWSTASNLAQGDNNEGAHVFLYNRDVSGSGLLDQPGNTHLSRILVSPGALYSGNKGLDISADGRYIVFNVWGWNGHECAYYTNYYLCSDVAVYDQQTGQTTLVSHAYDGLQSLANGWSIYPAISADGRYITYYSMAEANNIVPGDTNNLMDVFLYDQQTGQNTLISTGMGGAPADGDSGSPAISGHGKSVVFSSIASNLVTGKTNGVGDVFVSGTPPQILFPRVYLPLIIK
jgi:hypothetical protein